ncbi:quinone-dependent dihydroorotate dehydrogenase [Candidatus Saccharibacteria bacterium]|nr:quinone-dependent dihydroorotate dehydrogenase [Candidatus Saccharibacteria bacterium]
MKQLIRLITHWLYVYIVKPILFRYKPDGVHHGMIALTKWVQGVPGLRELPRLWSYHNDDMLAQEIQGVTFRNPVGLSAGFDKEISMLRMIRAVGFGWMTGGSVTWGSYKGNDGAWYYRLPKTKSLVVNAGLPSEGTEVVSQRVSNYDMKLVDGFPLNVSVAKTNTKQCADDETAIEDYTASLKEFSTLKQVTMLEINISCPNTFGGEPFTTSERLEKLLAAVDKLSLTKPVFIKMPINLPFADFDALLSVISQHNITGVAIGNLHKDRKAVDVKDVLPDDVIGNLSGEPTKALTTELIRHTYRNYQEKLVIIGIGGIFTSEDAYEKIKAGASLVAMITGLIFEGPSTPGQINHDLVKLLKADGYTNIRDAIGRESVV